MRALLEEKISCLGKLLAQQALLMIRRALPYDLLVAEAIH